MANLPKKLEQKLEKRRLDNSFRILPGQLDLVDFSSNDYLGFTIIEKLSKIASDDLKETPLKNGSTGSRLLTGNHPIYGRLENFLENFYDSESALVFNSGYDANLGFFSSVPQRGDIILFDELIHASIRDGIRLSDAKNYKFSHNDFDELEKRVLSCKEQSKISESQIYVVTESVFSMDGDSPNLKALTEYCSKNRLLLIVDEAHAVGVLGDGKGLVCQLGLQSEVFARIVTFGKALGCHGAAVLGSNSLNSYLVNFARSFMYTTALPPHTIATILAAHKFLENDRGSSIRVELKSLIKFFKKKVQSLGLQTLFLPSNSAIQVAILAGNEKVKQCAEQLQNNEFDVRPILAPTVSRGNERLRICLHAFNTKDQVTEMLNLISKFYHG